LQIRGGLQARRLETKQHVRLIGIYLPGRFFFCRHNVTTLFWKNHPELWWRKGNYLEEDSKKRLAKRVLCHSTTLTLSVIAVAAI
jgi:hypothetical protein